MHNTHNIGHANCWSPAVHSPKFSSSCWDGCFGGRRRDVWAVAARIGSGAGTTGVGSTKTGSAATGSDSGAGAATEKRTGGFRERLHQCRTEAREAMAPSPACPECGKPMHKRKAKAGKNAGQEFWGCTGYPGCKGSRRVEPAPSPIPAISLKIL